MAPAETGAGSAVMQVEENDVVDAGWQLLNTHAHEMVTSNLGVTFPLVTFLQGMPLNADEVSWYLVRFQSFLMGKPQRVGLPVGRVWAVWLP